MATRDRREVVKRILNRTTDAAPGVDLWQSTVGQEPDQDTAVAAMAPDMPKIKAMSSHIIKDRVGNRRHQRTLQMQSTTQAQLLFLNQRVGQFPQWWPSFSGRIPPPPDQIPVNIIQLMTSLVKATIARGDPPLSLWTEGGPLSRHVKAKGDLRDQLKAAKDEIKPSRGRSGEPDASSPQVEAKRGGSIHVNVDIEGHRYSPGGIYHSIGSPSATSSSPSLSAVGDDNITMAALDAQDGASFEHYHDHSADLGDVASSIGDASSREGDQSIFQLEDPALEQPIRSEPEITTGPTKGPAIKSCIAQLRDSAAELQGDTILAVMDAIRARLPEQKATKIVFVDPLWFQVDSDTFLGKTMFKHTHDTEIALVPLHHMHPRHWSLAEVLLRDWRIVYFDSLVAGYEERLSRITATLAQFLERELDKTKVKGPFLVTRGECPTQDDAINCGVFTLMCAYNAVSNELIPPSRSANQIREIFASMIASPPAQEASDDGAESDVENTSRRGFDEPSWDNVLLTRESKRKRQSNSPPPRNSPMSAFHEELRLASPSPAQEVGRKDFHREDSSRDDSLLLSPQQRIRLASGSPGVQNGISASDINMSIAGASRGFVDQWNELSRLVNPGVVLPPRKELEARLAHLTRDRTTAELRLSELRGKCAESEQEVTELRSIYQRDKEECVKVSAWYETWLSNAPNLSSPGSQLSPTPASIQVNATRTTVENSLSAMNSELDRRRVAVEEAEARSLEMARAKEQCSRELQELEDQIVATKDQIKIGAIREQVQQIIERAKELK
ncbi:hypothetical protein QBC47DRAFT_395591 [Echria macrotheca]|uniref:Ubiquitin-like protease family profile domain-containing protein n=1 Tax=Echria macrotheca TaxID=438768 RepID=A0AAJ0B559_9PEZI|nr:hypothetical protein QBC47DRAFT_395591 [Echria macrotheca]